MHAQLSVVTLVHFQQCKLGQSWAGPGNETIGVGLLLVFNLGHCNKMQVPFNLLQVPFNLMVELLTPFPDSPTLGFVVCKLSERSPV